jgi:FkbM family methyltransferase
MSAPASQAYIPHVGWLRHEPGEEVVSLLRQGYFEASEQALFWLYLRPGDTFIDCGAHIGLYSITADRATGGAARIIALEPGAATSGHLEANLRANGVRNAEVVRAAVWSTPGNIRFIEESDGKAAYAHVAFAGDDGGDSVPATTLDDVVRGAGVREIAIAKIDVEGAEPEVMQGAARAIARGALPLLMIEFTEHNLRRRGLSSAELFVQARDLGYTLTELSPDTLELVPFVPDGPIWFRNLFACRDLGAANARLRTASEANRAIARDILDRARACDRFKELEELDLHRQAAGEAPALRQWAEEADARTAAATKLADDNRAWAQRSDALLAREKEISAELRAWAERAEGQVAMLKAGLEMAPASERTELAALRAALAAIRAELEKLQGEVTPLRAFAQHYGWLYRWFRIRKPRP